MVGEISAWPRGGPQKRLSWRGLALILIGLISLVAYAALVGDEDPKLLPQVVGCYLNHQHRVAIIVDRSSVLRAEGLTIPITLYDLKWGGARLLPFRTIVYNPATGRIEHSSEDPSFIDTDRFFGSLLVQGAGYTHSLYLLRVPCPSSSSAATH